MARQNNEANDEMRFSDEKLFEFHNEFKDHMQRCEQRFNEGDEQFRQLLEAQQRNTDAISALIEETRDIVQLHRDWQGAARIGTSAQKFGFWLAKWGTIGVGLAAIWNWGLKELAELFR